MAEAQNALREAEREKERQQQARLKAEQEREQARKAQERAEAELAKKEAEARSAAEAARQKSSAPVSPPQSLRKKPETITSKAPEKRPSTNTSAAERVGYKPESAERKQMMDALREPIERRFGKKIIFQVLSLDVSGAVATARVRCLEPSKGKTEGAPYRGIPEISAVFNRNGAHWQLSSWTGN
jgi:hypothetical protein